MTLTEFLLARIAEDEENSRRYLDLLPGGDMAPLLRRVLAECEAKRRIVEWASGGEGEFHWMSVLHPLALPYADHPDYRDEWRP